MFRGRVSGPTFRHATGFPRTVSSGTAPTFTADTPPTAYTINLAISRYTFTASGSPAPTFAVSSGALPTGLALSSAGALTGTPTAGGTFTFTVTATNSAGTATTPTITIIIGPIIIPTYAWWDASDLTTITAAAGQLTAWNDKSGNAHNMSHGASANLLSGATTVNGLNSVSILADTGSMGFNPNVPQPATILFVLKSNIVPAIQQQYNVNVGADYVFASGTAANVNKWAYYAGTLQISAAAIDTSAHLVDAIFNGAASQLDLDKATISSANPGTNGYSGTDPLRFAYPSNSFQLCEWLWYNTALSGADLLAEQNYLRAKWGTP